MAAQYRGVARTLPAQSEVRHFEAAYVSPAPRGHKQCVGSVGRPGDLLVDSAIVPRTRYL